MLSWFSKMDRNRPHAARAPFASKAPAGTIVYAIGDIHGRLDLLQTLERKIERDDVDVDAERRLIVCVGDYIDRGGDSFGVIEHLTQDPPDRFERICLIGNHESFLLRFLGDHTVAANWLDNGGRETLSSYGITPPPWFDLEKCAPEMQAELRECLPASHEAFLQSLALSHREGDYFFVHAGVRPGVPLDRQDPDDLIWIREEFLFDERDFGAVVVHGHSIRREPESFANRIGVDTGAYATERLTCVVLWENERRFLST